LKTNKNKNKISPNPKIRKISIKKNKSL
jgi:hypothetical protein